MVNPTPPGLTGFRLLQAVKGDNRARLAAWVRLRDQYGDIVYGNFGKWHFYLLNHPDLVQQALVGQADKVTRIELGKKIRTAPPAHIPEDKAYHRKWRKLIAPAFTPGALRPYTETMVAHTLEMLDGWQHGETRAIDSDMTALTLRIVARSLFDADVTDSQAAFSRAITLGSEYLAKGSVIPLPTPRNLRLLGAWIEVDKTIKRVIAERRHDHTRQGDLLSTLIAAVDHEDGFRLNDQQVHGLVLSLFVAGHETTATALTWTFDLLAAHPEVQARLHHELDSVLNGRAPTVDDLADLPYADGVIREAMRLYPPAWALVRQAFDAPQIGGYTIPNGGLLLMSPYVIGRDARFYPEPDRFKPERWQHADDMPRYAYFPFGGGAHVCVGQFFALTEAQLIVATIASQYRFTRTAPPPEIEPLITLRPKGMVRLRIDSRWVL